ncbi:hypothetical protein FOA52_009744 [Chlamydomonas sp. UWO 241]|nr:hypothetical protein FOA52_009744 [Chlamydomonas sp. UWO 241]
MDVCGVPYYARTIDPVSVLESCSPTRKPGGEKEMGDALDFLCFQDQGASEGGAMQDGIYGCYRAQAEQELQHTAACPVACPARAPYASEQALRSHVSGSHVSDISFDCANFTLLRFDNSPFRAAAPLSVHGSDDDGVFPSATSIELLLDADECEQQQQQQQQLSHCHHAGAGAASMSERATGLAPSRWSSAPHSTESIATTFSRSHHFITATLDRAWSARLLVAGSSTTLATAASMPAAAGVSASASPRHDASRGGSCPSSQLRGSGGGDEWGTEVAGADAESDGGQTEGTAIAAAAGGVDNAATAGLTMTRPRRAAALMLSQLASARGKKRGGTGSTARKLAPHPNGLACSACGATATPVWRYGPHGPKTLCNACGVRYMKVAKSRK